MAKKKRFHSPLFLAACVVVAAVVLSYWSVQQFIVAPTSVNRIGAGTIHTYPVLGSPAPAGCEYHQVQCMRAPCNPILVCGDDLQSGSASPVAYASSAPIHSELPAPSCIARPACLDAAIPCSVTPPVDGEFCPRSSVTPSVSPQASPMQPTCRKGISELQMSGVCGSDSYNAVRYICKSEERARMLNEGCLNYATIVSKVNTICSQTCAESL